MTNINSSLSFKGLNVSKISPQDMKWLEAKPWWKENQKAISNLAQKYDIEIQSANQNIGARLVHNISTLEVTAKHLGAKSGLFGTTKGSKHFDVELYDVLKNSDKTLLDTVNKAIKDIKFLFFQ